jgi:hypothetical protein
MAISPSSLNVLKKDVKTFVVELEPLATVKPVEGRLDLLAQFVQATLALLEKPQGFAHHLGLGAESTALKHTLHESLEFRRNLDGHHGVSRT